MLPRCSLIFRWRHPSAGGARPASPRYLMPSFKTIYLPRVVLPVSTAGFSYPVMLIIFQTATVLQIFLILSGFDRNPLWIKTISSSREMPDMYSIPKHLQILFFWTRLISIPDLKGTYINREVARQALEVSDVLVYIFTNANYNNRDNTDFISEILQVSVSASAFWFIVCMPVIPMKRFWSMPGQLLKIYTAVMPQSDIGNL